MSDSLAQRGCALAVASPGGHLDELFALVPRLIPADQRVVWVTADTAQSRSLLRGEKVEWVREVGARQAWQAARSLPSATRLMRLYRPTALVSTGAALSVPYLLAARARRIDIHFVDSATRLRGPSLTGRMMQCLPRVHLYCQSDSWASDRWQRIESVFTSYAVRSRRNPGGKRVLVSVGTERFSFSRAVEAVAAAMPADAEVVWQVGHTTPPPGLQGTVHQWLTFDQMRSAVRDADVVITHCGVGSVLLALRNGKCPVVLPRLARHEEHVDDHQVELARELTHLGLGLAAAPDGKDLKQLIERARLLEAVPRGRSSGSRTGA